MFALVLTAGACAGINSSEKPSPALPQSQAEDVQDSNSITKDSASKADATGFGIGLSRKDSNFIFRALEELIRRCMDERGFQYTPNEPLEDWVPIPTSVIPLQSQRQADEEAYGLSNIFNEDDPDGVVSYPDPNRYYVEQLSEVERAAWSVAFNGSSDDQTTIELELSEEQRELELGYQPADELFFNNDACTIMADVKIYGDLGRFLHLASLVSNVLSHDPVNIVLASSTYIDAVKGWSDCMFQSGYEFAEPTNARSAASAAFISLTREQAIQFETQLASADGACGEKVGLFETVDRELEQAKDRVITEYEGEIIGYQELLAAAVERAKDVLR